MKLALVLSVVALTFSVAAEDFVPARILDVQNASAMKADTIGRVFGAGSSAVTQDDYLQITFETSDRRITARTFTMGGGMVWAMNHPEALIVGSDVKVSFAKHGVLLVQVPGKELKLDINRLEIVTH